MIEQWFGCGERGSSWRVEIMAGVSTFLSLSYIFVVNPSILGDAGMPRQAVFFATIVASAAATLAMGCWTNLPYILAPGMEINVYVASYAIAKAGLTWQEALGAVFWSGVLFLLFTLSGLRQGIMASLPEPLKNGLAACVGILLASLAFRFSGLLRYDGGDLLGLGSFDGRCVVMIATAVVAFALAALRIRAAVLLSIVAGACIAAWLGVVDLAASVKPHGGMLAAVGAADLSVLLRPRGWTIVLVLFLVDFYGSVAKFVGLIRNTSVMRDGKVPRLREALLIDGVAAAGGSLLGTTSVLVYAESGVAIAAGGRTGLTAITAGVAMLVCFTAGPLLAYVPVAATSGALLYVAYRLWPGTADLRKLDMWQLLALGGMVAIVFATSALHLALLLGLGVQLMRDIFQRVRLNPYAIGSFALLLIGWVIS